MAIIKIGDLDVIESGNIVSPNNQSIKITLDGEVPFTVVMNMTFPEKKSDSKLEAFEIDEVGIGLNLINFHHTLGAGNGEPIKLGWFQGRNLFINYRVFPINNNLGGIFEFTFLLGKKVDTDGREID